MWIITLSDNVVQDRGITFTLHVHIIHVYTAIVCTCRSLRFLVFRFLYQDFVSQYKATVEEMHRGEYEVAGMPLTLDILDTSGSSPFPAMRRLSISTGDAFVLVYSVQDESSFEEVKALRQQIIEEKGEEAMSPIVIVGNKAEVTKEERQISKEVAESTASIEWGHGYVEASAKEGFNVASIFMELLRQADFHVAESALVPKVTRRRGSYPTSKDSTTKKQKHSGCTIS